MRKVKVTVDDRWMADHFNPDIRTFSVDDGVILPEQIKEIRNLGWRFAQISNSSFDETTVTIVLWSSVGWEDVGEKIMEILRRDPSQYSINRRKAAELGVAIGGKITSVFMKSLGEVDGVAMDRDLTSTGYRWIGAPAIEFVKTWFYCGKKIELSVSVADALETLLVLDPGLDPELARKLEQTLK